MCTAASFRNKDFYFGRTLDHEESYGEQVVVVSRNFEFKFKHQPAQASHYAMIGMALVMADYPLFYDATNEKGLSIAGLNFVGNAYYAPLDSSKDNVAQFELLPWLLGSCANVQEVRAKLANLNICDTPFAEGMPQGLLHWMIADKDECIVLEAMRDGLHIYDNPAGVMTNNPPFDKQLFQLNNYRQLSSKTPENTFADDLNLDKYCLGLGALGLPGDWSSESRFARIAFARAQSKPANDDELTNVNQFFHMLNTVDQTRGLVQADDGRYQITYYSSCCNAERGIYYYTTYENHQISAVDMHKCDLGATNLQTFALNKQEMIACQN